MLQLSSCLCDELRDFLSMRKASVCKCTYAHDKQIIKSFDNYLIQSRCDDKLLTEELVLGWVAALEGKSRTVASKVIVIRIFTYFLSGYGIHTYIPHVPKMYDDYTPYIFSDLEIKQIFGIADRLEPGHATVNPMLHIQMPVILRLMYGCGLRIGETVKLQMKDIDLDTGVLVMRFTKGGKQRKIPMHDSLTQVLSKYCNSIGLVGKPDAWLFPTANEAVPVTAKNAKHRFNRILDQSGIFLPGRSQHERGPCLHCLRHKFVFKSFAQVEAMGLRVDDAVPYLSVYLGHDSLRETEKYLKFSSELYPEAMEKFETYTLGVFPEVHYES